MAILTLKTVVVISFISLAACLRCFKCTHMDTDLDHIIKCSWSNGTVVNCTDHDLCPGCGKPCWSCEFCKTGSNCESTIPNTSPYFQHAWSKFVDNTGNKKVLKKKNPRRRQQLKEGREEELTVRRFDQLKEGREEEITDNRRAEQKNEKEEAAKVEKTEKASKHEQQEAERKKLEDYIRKGDFLRVKPEEWLTSDTEKNPTVTEQTQDDGDYEGDFGEIRYVAPADYDDRNEEAHQTRKPANRKELGNKMSALAKFLNRFVKQASDQNYPEDKLFELLNDLERRLKAAWEFVNRHLASLDGFRSWRKKLEDDPIRKLAKLLKEDNVQQFVPQDSSKPSSSAQQNEQQKQEGSDGQ